MDFKKLLEGIRKGVEFVETLTPLIGVLPGGKLVTTVISAVNAVDDIVENVQTRVKEGQIVLDSDDQAELKDLVKRIQTENDRLAEYIRNS